MIPVETRGTRRDFIRWTGSLAAVAVGVRLLRAGEPSPKSKPNIVFVLADDLGCGGQRVRNVTVENVNLKKGYFRGAVEVSDGTDNITVRRVRADDAVYAIDVQDHGAVQKGKPGPSAPNTNIVVEGVTAVGCKHVIRTANRPLGHANLVLCDFSAWNCKEPVLISTNVCIEGLTRSTPDGGT